MDNKMKKNSGRYEAIIFDMDGVIINSKEYVEEFWLEKLDEHGIEIPMDEREVRFHGRPARPTVNDLFADLPEEKREEIIKQCGEYDASVERYPMIPGVERLLKECVENGIRIGLVTSALPGKVDRMLAGLSFQSPFEVIVTADLVINGKPDPECYLLAADKLNVSPQKIVVFEDSVSGVKAASWAGATVVGINEYDQAHALNAAGAISVLPDLQKTEVVRENGSMKLYPAGKEETFFLISAVE